MIHLIVLYRYFKWSQNLDGFGRKFAKKDVIASFGKQTFECG